MSRRNDKQTKARMKTTMPIQNQEYLHPFQAMTEGRIMPDRKSPRPMPPDTMPVASPLFLTANQAAGKAIMGM